MLYPYYLIAKRLPSTLVCHGLFLLLSSLFILSNPAYAGNISDNPEAWTSPSSVQVLYVEEAKNVIIALAESYGPFTVYEDRRAITDIQDKQDISRKAAREIYFKEAQQAVRDKYGIYRCQDEPIKSGKPIVIRNAYKGPIRVWVQCETAIHKRSGEEEVCGINFSLRQWSVHIKDVPLSRCAARKYFLVPDEHKGVGELLSNYRVYSGDYFFDTERHILRQQLTEINSYE